MADVKTVPTRANVTEFLEKVTDETRRRDCMTILAMMKKAASAEPVMWGTSIVGFGQYHYRYESGREGDMPVIGFSPRKQDLTLYFMTGFKPIEGLMARLGKFKTGKGCLYIKRLADVDLAVLQTMIEQSVQGMEPSRVDR